MDAAAYDALARSIERELELLGEARFEELTTLHVGRQKLIESLPSTPPAHVRPALQRAVMMSKRVENEILRRREALLRELATVELVDRTARGYAPPRTELTRIQATA